jgi:hypothetical protein
MDDNVSSVHHHVDELDDDFTDDDSVEDLYYVVDNDEGRYESDEELCDADDVLDDMVRCAIHDACPVEYESFEEYKRLHPGESACMLLRRSNHGYFGGLWYTHFYQQEPNRATVYIDSGNRNNDLLVSMVLELVPSLRGAVVQQFYYRYDGDSWAYGGYEDFKAEMRGSLLDTIVDEVQPMLGKDWHVWFGSIPEKDLARLHFPLIRDTNLSRDVCWTIMEKLRAKEVHVTTVSYGTFKYISNLYRAIRESYPSKGEWTRNIGTV